MQKKVFFITVLSFVLISGLATGGSDTECDKSIASMESKTFVPKKVLYKIALLETGRKLNGRLVSWPWSLNNAGISYFFKDRRSALEKINELILAGEVNIDVGCMQLNWRWHGRHFDNLSSMIDPKENVNYASKFLEQLYEETGSWDTTVKYYHSRNPVHYTKYFEKFNSINLSKEYAFQHKGGQEQNTNNRLFLFGKVPKIPVDKNNLFAVESFSLYGSRKSDRMSFNLRNFKVSPLLDM